MHQLKTKDPWMADCQLNLTLVELGWMMVNQLQPTVTKHSAAMANHVETMNFHPYCYKFPILTYTHRPQKQHAELPTVLVGDDIT